ncbi:ABC transporter ATP-binding protein [Brevundimonas sp. 2R-24]|uniref:ABC transporter ATP-binding protein n=1 Tax=Peiella sedimenti TaxID=3061083 RepID=A0ABT8SNK4_9CAUL|nr:ABC transporter ATP-binding protein [Caulobacteraceae bacterium XZ-24]
MTAEVHIDQVRKAYGSRLAVADASQSLAPGAVTCLLGPSGCGKSTLLRLIAGLERLDSGRITMGGRTLSGAGVHVPVERRRIGLVFQDFALFPHLTLLQNVAFGLGGLARAERRARALELLERVHLADRANAYPHVLSGGEQQRVALARALAPRPEAVLLDEPFSGLDGALRETVRRAALELIRETGAACLLVTHDVDEALMAADALAVMHQGRILQTGAPQDVYQRPTSAEAARLLGPINLIPARIADGVAFTAVGEFPASGAPAGAGRLGVRPEDVALTTGNALRVRSVRFAGGRWTVELTGPDGLELRASVTGTPPREGETAGIRLDPGRLSVFGSEKN